MGEVAAHQPARLLAVLGAGLVIEVGDLLEPAIAHGSGKRRHDQAAAQPRRQLDRGLGERSDIGRDRPLHRLRRDPHVVERIMLAVMRDAIFRRPQPAHQLHAFLEDALVVVERHMERLVFAPVVAAAAGEIDAAVGEQIERRPLLGDANWMVQRQHRHRRREPDARGVGGDIAEDEIRTGQNAERVEMMLADPGRVHAELVGIERLGDDVGDELIGGAGIVGVMVVAEREIAEVHDGLLEHRVAFGRGRGRRPRPVMRSLLSRARHP